MKLQKKRTGSCNRRKVSILFLVLVSVCLRAVPSITAQEIDNQPLFDLSWGSQGQASGQFINPVGIAVDNDGYVYVTDSNNHRVQKFDSRGGFITQWGSYGGGDGEFLHLQGIATDNRGHVYVLDEQNRRLQKFDTEGNFITAWGGIGNGDGQFGETYLGSSYGYPVDLVVDTDGYVYVTDSTDRVQKFDTDGNFIATWGKYGWEDGEFQNPSGIAIDHDGHIYVADNGNCRIQKFDLDGHFISKWDTGDTPGDVAVDGEGNIYVLHSSLASASVQQFDTDGNFITEWGSYGWDTGQFKNPRNMTFDAEGNIYIVDSGNHRVQKLFFPFREEKEPVEEVETVQIEAPCSAGGTVEILYTGDLYGRLLPEDGRGGMANIAGHVNHIRNTAGHRVILLDAGDTWQGTPLSNHRDGEVTVAAMNLMGYDAWVPGNHDFDQGQDNLQHLTELAQFPALGANVWRDGELWAATQPWVLLEGCPRVAVVGVTNPETPFLTNPRGITGIRFEDAVDAISRYLPDMQRQADVIVVLSHLGEDGDRALAQSISEIDLIIGGHTHHCATTPPEVVNGHTMLLAAGQWGEYLGQATVTFQPDGNIAVNNQLIEVLDGSAPHNAAVAELLAGHWAEITPQMEEVVGQTAVDLDIIPPPEYGARRHCPNYTPPPNSPARPSGEFPFGNLIADALLRSLPPASGTSPVVAIFGNNGARVSIPAGEVKYKQLIYALPFSNRLIHLTLSGADLQAVLEQWSGDISVANLRYNYAPSARTVWQVMVGDQPLELDRYYRVVTVDFLADGGSGRDAFLRHLENQQRTEGMLLVDAVTEYLRNHSPAELQTAERIRVGSPPKIADMYWYWPDFSSGEHIAYGLLIAGTRRRLMNTRQVEVYTWENQPAELAFNNLGRDSILVIAGKGAHDNIAFQRGASALVSIAPVAPPDHAISDYPTDLSHLQLALFLGSHTGSNSDAAGSLLGAAQAKGINATVGFATDVGFFDSLYWNDMFWRELTEGTTVSAAARGAAWYSAWYGFSCWLTWNGICPWNVVVVGPHKDEAILIDE